MFQFVINKLVSKILFINVINQTMNECIDLCSAIKSEATPPQPIDITQLAPNRLLNWSKIKQLVEPQLKECPVCNQFNVQLKDEIVYGFEVNIMLSCETCTKTDYQYRHSINNLNRMIKSNITPKKYRRVLQRNMYHLKSKI